MVSRPNASRPQQRRAERETSRRRSNPLAPSAAETSAVLKAFTVLGVLVGIMQLLLPLVDPWMAAVGAVTTAGVLGVGYVCGVRLTRRWRRRVVLRTWVALTVVVAAIAAGWMSGFTIGGGW